MRVGDRGVALRFIRAVRVLADHEPDVVWVLEQDWEFESAQRIGVFTSRSRAQEHPVPTEDPRYSNLVITPVLLDT